MQLSCTEGDRLTTSNYFKKIWQSTSISMHKLTLFISKLCENFIIITYITIFNVQTKVIYFKNLHKQWLNFELIFKSNKYLDTDKH